MNNNSNNNEKFVVKKRFKIGAFDVFRAEVNSKVKRVIFLGLEIYSLEDNFKYRIQKFFKNFITTFKTKSTDNEEKLIKIFNFEISKRIFKDSIYSYYFLNLPVYKKDERKNIYKKIFKNLKNDFDDVYILNSNSGEMFLFFAYLAKNFLAKNNSKAPLFVALDDYHEDIIKIFFPQAKCVNRNGLKITITQDCFKYGKNRFFVCFSKKHFENIEYAIQNIPNTHYFTEIQKTLEIETPTSPDIANNAEIEEQINEKMSLIDLNLDNFILLAPEAKSCCELESSFWFDLAQKLKEKGFDVYLNAINPKNMLDGLKTAKLNFEELFYLAKKARAIISLRSGLSEFLLPTKTPNLTIYTPFRRLKNSSFTVDMLMNGFLMHKIPFVDNSKIKEFNYENYQIEAELMQDILNNLDNLGI